MGSSEMEKPTKDAKEAKEPKNPTSQVNPTLVLLIFFLKKWSFSQFLLNVYIFDKKILVKYMPLVETSIPLMFFDNVQEQASSTGAATVTPDWSGFQVPLIESFLFI